MLAWDRMLGPSPATAAAAVLHSASRPRRPSSEAGVPLKGSNMLSSRERVDRGVSQQRQQSSSKRGWSPGEGAPETGPSA